ncbi:17S U2 SnRNP complex component HTATSF1 [Loxodonta africana]|uniref:17S U2 SnRNP complex component HTATSF1 n=1 Tax=Loxodonta africana TaxID=9785 RepID=UPI0005404521|nr:HIV Tat-specific factor 1 [Loxodonta africana]XP_010598347.1 HIV Tat-specific factor 1 [Loxodonta africana]
MSGNNLSGNDEFDEQLRMQELYGDPKDGDPQEDPGGEADSLGQQPTDTPYEWDLDKKAWFPKITEDFIATYQANYGFSNDGASSSTANVQDVSAGNSGEPPQRKPPEPTEPKKKGEKRKAESGWFHVEEDRNTNVYVSGLPPDITVDEFIQLMSKFGIIMRDPQTEEFKVKLYKDNQGNLKGDGLCCYLKRESVELALKLLDEDEIRGYKLHVEVAKFQLKGEYDASKKKKKCKDYKKKLSMQQKQLDWRPERKAGPSRMRHERVVIIKNMFHPMDFEDDPLVLNEIREDLRVECSKFGQIKKLILFDRHPDGVASVSFRDPEEADYCIHTLDGRWFGGRQITAEAWDGTTDYQVEETTREREERLRGWEAFLNEPEANRGFRRSNLASASERAGPSRVRHFSEHPSTSRMNAPEAAAEMTFGAPVDKRKFEKPEDGGKFEEEASEKDADEGGRDEESEEGRPERGSEEGCHERGSEEGCRERGSEEGCRERGSEEGCRERGSEEGCRERGSEEGCRERGSEEGCRERGSEEGCPERGSEEGCRERGSEEGCPERGSEEGCRERGSEEGRPERGSEEGCPERGSEEDSPGKESEENGSEREPEQKTLKKDSEKNGLEKESKEDSLEKDSEDDSEGESGEDGSEKQCEDGSEKEFEENGLEKEIDEDDSEKEFENILEKELEDSEKSECEDDGSEKACDEEGSEREFEEDSDEKEEEEDAGEKVFDDESDEKEDEENADDKGLDDAEEKEEDEAEEKLFEDADRKGDIVEKLFEDDKLFDEDTSDKLFEPNERGPVGCFENPQEEEPLSTGSSFVLSSDDDDDDI